ncbi:hypothetical protein DRQ00_10825, partial [candidate division KSB1 bacterium]
EVKQLWFSPVDIRRELTENKKAKIIPGKSVYTSSHLGCENLRKLPFLPPCLLECYFNPDWKQFAVLGLNEVVGGVS